MPAITTRYQSPLSFDQVWVNVEHTSELDGVDNNQVPTALSAKASTKNTWSLYIDGAPVLQNYSFGSGYQAVTANSVQGGRYDLGGLIEKVTYTKSVISAVTSDVVTIGATDAGIDGFGLIEGAAGSETVAWVRTISSDATTIKFKGVTINAGFLSQSGRDSNGGIVNAPFGDVVFIDGNGNKYTRGQHQYSTATTDVYKVGKKLPDVTNSVTQNVAVLEDTDYAFWHINETTSAEIDNFSASVSLIMPMHILMRSLTQTGGQWTLRGLDLDESFIRVAADAAAGQVQILDLKNNYGIDAIQVPINLVVGTSFVKIALNNLEDVNVTTPLNNQIVKYQNGIWNGSFLDFSDLANTPTTISGYGITDAYTKNELNAGQLDNQYYTETELNAGQLDNRYYTETEVDTNISTAISNLLDGAPAALDTLNELAAAINDDDSYASTITSALALKSDISSLHAVATSGSYTDLINLPTITLTALGDSSIATPVENQVLKYNGSAWVNEFMAGGATLGAVPTSPLVGEFWFDDTTSGFLYTWNGYSWVQLTTTANSFDGSFSGLAATPTTIAGYGITDAFNGAFSSLTSTPTTLAGYGITNAATSAQGAKADTALQSLSFSGLASTPTTLAGYGITDASSTIVAIQAAAPSSPADGDLWFDDTTLGELFAWDGYSWVQMGSNPPVFDGAFSSLTATPTTIAGYGITDAAVGVGNAGDVGTYAFLGRATAGSFTTGTTYAGSLLKYSGFASTNAFNDNTAADVQGTTPSGTWRAMGYAATVSTRIPSTLFLRIS